MKRENNLVWIDLEMTGLDPTTDVILEIAAVITDENLNILQPGIDCVIHQPDTILETMNDWCKKQHAASGLTKRSKESTITIKEAEQKVLEFIETYCYPQTSSLCGNSIWQDRFFLQTYMPDIVNFLHYRMIDVTAVKRLVRLWYPKSNSDFKKKDTHRALVDIEESIAELKFYREHFFVKE